MKVMVMGSWAPSLLAFRGHLLTRMVELGHDVVTCAADGTPELERELLRRGIRYRDLPLARAGTNPIADCRAFTAMVALLRTEAPDLFLGYTVKPVVYGCLAARAAGVPRSHALITGLGYAFIDRATVRRRLLGALVQQLYRQSLRGTEGVIFQNPDDLAEFRAQRLLPEDSRVQVVNGSGVDVELFAQRPLSTEPLRFLFVGRLLREKGILELIEAARRVKQQRPDVQFQILGAIDPNPASVGKPTVEQWQREGVVEYLGETRDVRPYLDRATVLVLPSYREGTPRSVLEAMAVGRPIIATDVPGCRETVEHGRNGLLVPARNAEALADAVLELAHRVPDLPRMGAESRRIAEEKYDVRLVTTTMLQALELA